MLFRLTLILSCLVPLAADAQRGVTVAERQQYVSEQRVALVIGNGGYTSSPLRNPPNDARAMAAALRRCGFEVTERIDVGRKDMFRAVREFGEQIKRGGVGLFYYAGHGMQVNGRNYLVPVGVDIRAEDEIAIECLDAALVLNKMETAGNRVNIVVLDACRNNPFARSFRSASRGLARMDAPAGSFLAYATAPGDVAADGTGSNGVYTAALLERLQEPGLKIEDVFKGARSRVMDETGRTQVPWESSSLTGDFYFLLTDDGRSQVDVELAKAAAQSAKAEAERLRQELETQKAEQERLQAEAEVERLRKELEGLRPQEGEGPMVRPSVEVSSPAVDVEHRDMAFVPGGAFHMGSDNGDNDEKPVHVVHVDGFWIDAHEVTNKKYAAFVDGTGRRSPDSANWGKAAWNTWMGGRPPAGYDDHPVVGVTWEDASAYCASLGKRLPTEAEWEKACRGGMDSKDYAWGDGIAKSQANYGQGQGGETGPVGSYPPNGYGLYDMSGSVWEWCADWHAENYYGRSPTANPRGPARGQLRVLRGGSWYDGAANIRCASRSWSHPQLPLGNAGFRCAKSE